MGFVFTKEWDTAVEKQVRDFSETLSEKDRRRFAAVQARQLGHGGVKYMAAVVGCSRRTIERGLAELATLPQDPAAGQIRRPGAGRKKSLARLARGTESEGGVGDAHGRRSRRRPPRFHRSLADDAVGYPDEAGHARVCGGHSALDGRPGPAIAQDRERPGRRALAGSGYPVPANRRPDRRVRNRRQSVFFS